VLERSKIHGEIAGAWARWSRLLTSSRPALAPTVPFFLASNLLPLLGVHRKSKGGTVNRPWTYANHRKQTVAQTQGRNFPVQLQNRDSSANARPIASSASYSTQLWRCPAAGRAEDRGATFKPTPTQHSYSSTGISLQLLRFPLARRTSKSNRELVSSRPLVNRRVVSSLQFSNREPDRSRPSRRCGLHSLRAAPKISAFMRFVGETRTIFRPGAARWALLFMGPQISTDCHSEGRGLPEESASLFGPAAKPARRCND
jgi:hypothetical protein